MTTGHAQNDLVRRLWRRIDDANAEDPRRVVDEGEEMAFEERHARRMTAWVLRLRPEASEPLLIAARGQHVRRWTVPRDSYPRDRAGYLRWRESLKRFHAETLAAFLAAEGADRAFVDRVRSLVMKKDLKGDPETQALEDALCLTFLETEFPALKAATPPEKLAAIVRKTWGKMSEDGRAAALGLDLAPDDATFIRNALAGGSDN